MSKLRASVLVTGLLAIAAIAFFFGGAGELVASTIDNGVVKSVTNGSCEDTKTSSKCTKKAKASCLTTSAEAGSDCSKKCSKSCSKTCAKAPSKACCKGKKDGSASNIEAVPHREGRVMVLTGHYVCGHCNLGATKKCHAAFQTSEGKNYLLVRNNLSKKLKKTARETDVVIKTRVKKYDGKKYLEVEAIKTL